MRPAGGIAQRRVLKTQLAGPVGHFRGERLFASRQGLGNDDARIVARLHDDPMDEILQFHPRAGVQEHGRAAAFRPPLAPRVFADRQGVIERKPAITQAFEDHVDGHHLAHRGRMHQVVGILLEQHRTGGHLHQQSLAGGALDRRRRPWQSDRDGEGGGEDEDGGRGSKDVHGTPASVYRMAIPGEARTAPVYPDRRTSGRPHHTTPPMNWPASHFMRRRFRSNAVRAHPPLRRFRSPARRYQSTTMRELGNPAPMSCSRTRSA